MKSLQEFKEQLEAAKAEINKVIQWIDAIQNQIQDQSQQVLEKET